MFELAIFFYWSKLSVAHLIEVQLIIEEFLATVQSRGRGIYVDSRFQEKSIFNKRLASFVVLFEVAKNESLKDARKKLYKILKDEKVEWRFYYTEICFNKFLAKFAIKKRILWGANKEEKTVVIRAKVQRNRCNATKNENVRGNATKR